MNTIPVLPDFTRWSWSSQTNRDWYAPLFSQFSSTFLELERLAVAEGIRPAAWQFVAPSELTSLTHWCQQHGLLLVPVHQTTVSGTYASGGGGPQGAAGLPSFRCVITRPEFYGEILPFDDDERIGRLLGYPECCRRSFAETWGRGLVDSTYEQLQATDWSQPTLASTLWRWLGVRLVPHLPCSYSCHASNELAEAFLTLGSKYHPELMAFAKEILALPLKWSRLFGIAEIVTPLVKVSTRSNWTPEIQRYDKQGKYTRISDALWKDNGFTSAQGMRDAHAPLLDVLRSELPSSARVMDLGCGNGLLLRRLRMYRQDVAIGGIDTNADAISRMPLLSGTWVNGTIQSLAWEQSKPDAVLLNPARLLEMSPEDAERTRTALQNVPLIVAYCYSDFREPLHSLVTTAGLGDVHMLAKTPAVSVGVIRNR